MNVMLALALAANVSFTSIAKGDISDQETAREAVARTAAEWQALWKDHAPGEKRPAVDFGSRMVVGVFLGTRPSSGYDVEIVGVRTDGDALLVEYAQRQPKGDMIAAQILTQPFHLIAVPKHGGPVRFVRVSDPAPLPGTHQK